MIQLAYQPSHDPFHAMFRLLRLRDGLDLGSIDADVVRILDFFLLHPHRIGSIRFKQGHARFRSLAQKYSDRRGYALQPSDRVLFESMAPMHEAATQTLAEANAIDASALERGSISFQKFEIPERLRARIRELNASEADLLEFLKVLSIEYPLLGRGGLKDRTNLMEHRYDAV